ncbi:hypothetical protein [endosymbiont 'TC1' of Trimyema compressum]|uniref:hypothetical protein n=1 Tax=endosymbiont 'TC1' of Trimyema compressum TaxID=243899 RepID=UPI00139220B9|nr:hypothetical protein [endosymbiont 'TC1' of Trimyema compressum]
MIRLPEDFLPDHIIILRQIRFPNYTNAVIIPQYFEYKYGVDGKKVIGILIELRYAIECNAKDSLPILNVDQIKRILKTNKQK